MRQIKYVLQITVLLLLFVLSVTLLLQSYNIYLVGYQKLGGLIEHPSIESVEQDREKELEQ